MKAIAYGFTGKETTLLEKVLGGNWSITDTQNFTDILAIKVQCIIVDSLQLTDEEQTQLNQVCGRGRDVLVFGYEPNDQGDLEHEFDTFLLKVYEFGKKFKSIENTRINMEVICHAEAFIALDADVYSENGEAEILSIDAAHYERGRCVARYHKKFFPLIKMKRIYLIMLECPMTQLLTYNDFSHDNEEFYKFIGQLPVVIYSGTIERKIIEVVAIVQGYSLNNAFIDITDVDAYFMGNGEYSSHYRLLVHRWLGNNSKDYVDGIAEVFMHQQAHANIYLKPNKQFADTYLDWPILNIGDVFRGNEKEIVVALSDAKDSKLIKKLKTYLNSINYEVVQYDLEDMDDEHLMGGLTSEGAGYNRMVWRSGPAYISTGKDCFTKRVILCDCREKKLSEDVMKTLAYTLMDSFRYEGDEARITNSKSSDTKYLLLTDDLMLKKKLQDWIFVGDSDVVGINFRAYRERVIDHIITYQSKLQLCKNKRTYILPEQDKFNNILTSYRGNFKDYYEYSGIDLHRYFHHLNSSQAMCFNLFYPLLKERRLEELLHIFDIIEDVKYDSVAFEKVSELEKGSGRKTNFDFYFQTEEGKKFYFEVKYTEDGFGQTKMDAEHIKKYHQVYEPLTQKHPGINGKCKNMDFFLEHYQLMRNLIHMDQNSYVIFIYPKLNEKVRNQAMEAMNEIVASSWSTHLIPISLEDIVDVLGSTEDNKLGQYYNVEFSDKYILDIEEGEL